MDYPPHGRTDIARRFEWDECVLGGGGGYATSSRRDWSSHALLLLLWLRENMNEIASFIELIQNLVYIFFHPSCGPSVVVVVEASIVRCTTSSTTMAAQRYTTYTAARLVPS